MRFPWLDFVISLGMPVAQASANWKTFEARWSPSLVLLQKPTAALLSNDLLRRSFRLVGVDDDQPQLLPTAKSSSSSSSADSLREVANGSALWIECRAEDVQVEKSESIHFKEFRSDKPIGTLLSLRVSRRETLPKLDAAKFKPIRMKTSTSSAKDAGKVTEIRIATHNVRVERRLEGGAFA